MERLTDLPNIGPKLAGNLERIGVTTQEQFQALGAEEGVEKSLLSSERKLELKAWYQRL